MTSTFNRPCVIDIRRCNIVFAYRGSYMNAHVLLNLLNAFGGKISCKALPSILSFPQRVSVCVTVKCFCRILHAMPERWWESEGKSYLFLYIYLISREIYFRDNFRENKSPRKCYTSVTANETGQRKVKINRRELTFHLQNAKINSLENK